MALTTKVGTFLADATKLVGQTIVISDVGFQPKVILFFYTGRSDASDAIGRATIRRGFGVAISATDRRAIYGHATDAAATSETARAQSVDGCVITCTASGGSIDGRLDFESMDAGGFTLVVDDQLPVSFRVSYLALGGDALTNAASGHTTFPLSTGNFDVTTVGFQPTALMVFTTTTASDPPSAQPRTLFGVGMATSASQRACCVGTSHDNLTTTDSQGYAHDGECFAALSSTGAPLERADFVSFLSNGFRLNAVEASGAIRMHWVALSGVRAVVDSLLTQTDTTTDIVVSGLGFAPSAIWFVSAMRAESTVDVSSAHDSLSLGAATSAAARVAHAMLDEDNVATAECTTAIEYDAVYANISTGSAIQGLMDVKSIDADGFTAIMDDADPAPNWVGWLAFGAPPAVSLPFPSRSPIGHLLVR